MKATIIARGGSVRFPRKNLQKVCGKTLVEWAILQCKCSHYIDEVIMGTDDEEIGYISEEAGATIFWREKKHSDETAGPVYKRMLNWLKERDGKLPVSQLNILPTHILKMPADIDNLIRQYCKMREDGMDNWTLGPLCNLKECDLTQKLEQHDGYAVGQTIIWDKGYGYYYGCGGWSVNDVERYIKYVDEMPQNDTVIDAMFAEQCKRRETPMTYIYSMPEWQHYEVDVPSDLKIVEALFKYYIGGEDPYLTYKARKIEPLNSRFNK